MVTDNCFLNPKIANPPTDFFSPLTATLKFFYVSFGSPLNANPLILELKISIRLRVYT